MPVGIVAMTLSTVQVPETLDAGTKPRSSERVRKGLDSTSKVLTGYGRLGRRRAVGSAGRHVYVWAARVCVVELLKCQKEEKLARRAGKGATRFLAAEAGRCKAKSTLEPTRQRKGSPAITAIAIRCLALHGLDRSLAIA